MKLYNLEYAQINYSQDILNGVNLVMKVAYEQRKPLFNTTDYSFFKRDDLYSSNNPLDPNDFSTAPFEQHHLFKTGINARINFGNKYISRPDGRYNFKDDRYPTVVLGFEKALPQAKRNMNLSELALLFNMI